jgi:hypothetical protein
MVVMECWADVPTADSMGGPCFSDVWFLMHKYFFARGCEWCAVVIKAPWSWACAERRRLIREPRMRFRESSACGSNLSQRLSGKLRSVLIIPAMKWFLNVHIARSAALRR